MTVPFTESERKTFEGFKSQKSTFRRKAETVEAMRDTARAADYVSSWSPMCACAIIDAMIPLPATYLLGTLRARQDAKSKEIIRLVDVLAIQGAKTASSEAANQAFGHPV